jgi:PHD-like zinc-binding domain
MSRLPGISAEPRDWRVDNAEAQRRRDWRELQKSRARLLAHPALLIPGMPAANSPDSLETKDTLASEQQKHRPLAPQPRAVLRTLFADLVRREMAALDVQALPPPPQYILHEDVREPVAPAPRLLSPPPDLSRGAPWADARATGHDPDVLGDIEQTKPVAVHPTEVPFHIPGAAKLEDAATKTAAIVKEAVARRATRSSAAKLAAEAAAAAVAASSVATTGTADGQAQIAEESGNDGARTRRKATANSGSIGGGVADGPKPLKPGMSVCCFCPALSCFGGYELDGGGSPVGKFVDHRGNARYWAHPVCANWAPQVYMSKNGEYKHVHDEYTRGRQLRCSGCHAKGATVGCYVERCKKTFHYRCLEPAGARRVEKYFVAFCSVHAHLADVESYQLMMEAATIADLSSTLRHNDSTFGMDTPHSKYTELPRGGSELIFSARAGITSVGGVFDSSKIVFSAHRREVISNNMRLTVHDRPRRIRVSAYSVATGVLALASLGHSQDSARDASPFQAAAALASKEHSRLLLLRNLEGSPDFASGDLRVTKKPKSRAAAAKAIAEERARMSPSTKALAAEAARAAASSDKKINQDRAAADASNVALPERPLVPGVPLSTNMKHATDVGGAYDEGSEDEPSSKRRCIMLRLALTAVGIAAVKVRREEENDARRKEAERQEHINRKQREREEKQRKRMGKEEELRKQASRVVGAPDKPISSSLPASVKIRSAWQIFLDEQLPRERALRPEDTMDSARRNMARLWGLLASYERAVYEEKAKQSRLGFGSTGDSGPTVYPAAGNAAVEAVSRKAVETAAAIDIIRGTSFLNSFNPSPTLRLSRGKIIGANFPRIRLGGESDDHDDQDDEDDCCDKVDAGLFSATVRKSPPAASAPPFNRHVAPFSVTLPRGRVGTCGVSVEEYPDDELDSLFPTSLGDAKASASVLPAPPLRRSKKWL